MFLKNKKSTYFLVPLVLLVWGILFWKIFAGFNGDDRQMVLDSVLPVLPNETRKIDSIPPPLCDYRDPFLKTLTGRIKKTSKAPVETKEENSPSQKSLNRVVRWPVVDFLGIVKSERKKDVLGILKIGNKEYLVRKNDIKEGIEVIHITSDSVGLKYQSDTSFFARKGL
jgi:hypothetical protein